MNARNRVALVGYAQSPIARHADRTLGVLAVETARAAVTDAGLRLADVDGVVGSGLFPTAGAHAVVDGVSSVTPAWLAAALGVDARFVSGFQGIGQIPGSVATAVHAITAGAADVVLMVRALHNPRGSYHGTTASGITGPQQWTASQGFFGPIQSIALPTQEYFARYGADRKALAAVVVEARRNGARIPWSAWSGKPLGTEAYLDAPLISEPIGRLDCDLPVDGVAVFVFARAEHARDLPHRPVLVTGVASSPPPPSRLPLHWPLDDIEDGGARTARRLWTAAGLGPQDVDLPQVYDGFSPFVWFWLEALGLVPPGEAHRFVQDGGIDAARPGALPALSGGGALGNGRMHGVPQMLECYLQLSGRAGERQRGGAWVAVACHASPHLGGAVVYTAS